MNFWLLTLSYWLHLLSTVIWLGGLATAVIVTLPALRQQTLDNNQWLSLQRRLIPWINGSLLVLLVTGFFQMTSDPNYAGFLVLDGIWAWSMLFKHIAFVGMAGLTLYQQFTLYPEMTRLIMLIRSRPELAARRHADLQKKERRFLWLNTACAVLILFFTAVMTAV